MLLFGVSYSMIAQFLFLFLRNDLGMDSSLIGWTGPIGGVAEVTTFWISNKVKGANRKRAGILGTKCRRYSFWKNTV